MFKWVCLALVVAISSVGLWMVNDIRMRSQESIANLEVITENVADIVVDIKALKNLSGLSTTRTDGGRLSYATSILSFMGEELEGKGDEIDSAGLIGRRKPIKDWLAGAGMESLGLVLGKAKTQEDVFWGLCQTFPGNHDFLLFFPDEDKGVKLATWLQEHHPDTQTLFR